MLFKYFLLTLLGANLFANEPIRFMIKNRAYNILIIKGQKIQLKEKTIDLSIEKKECNSSIFNELEEGITPKVNKYNAYLKQRSQMRFNCKTNSLEKEACRFLNIFPEVFKRAKVAESLACSKS